MQHSKADDQLYNNACWSFCPLWHLIFRASKFSVQKTSTILTNSCYYWPMFLECYILSKKTFCTIRKYVSLFFHGLFVFKSIHHGTCPSGQQAQAARKRKKEIFMRRKAVVFRGARVAPDAKRFRARSPLLLDVALTYLLFAHLLVAKKSMAYFMKLAAT